MSEEVSNSNSSSSHQEDVTSKYKRLLSMARSNLEANQKQLGEKDNQIAQLIAALEEERAKRIAQARIQREDDGQHFPRRILSRVDVEGVIWILLEYESIDDEWKSFNSESALHDYVKRIPGAPLAIPQKCLSVEESSRLVEDAKSKVERISEEFRKYKVKMEIHLKQREVEQRPSHSLNSALTMASASSNNLNRGGSAQSSSSITLPSALERALSQGNLTHSNIYQSEVEKLQVQLQEKETKWRVAYEKLAKELDMLKTKGAESVVAAQWRQRYEGCLRDKEDLHARLSLYQQLTSEFTEHGQSVEEMYVELQEEYKGLRKHIREMLDEHIQKQQSDNWSPSDIKSLWSDFMSAVEYYHIDQKDMDDSRLLQPFKLASSPRATNANGAYNSASGNTGENFTGGKGMVESKVQYVRHMVFQYLVCREPEVRTHIELALMALFRFSEEERAAIEAKTQEDSQDTLTTITNFIGSFTG